MAWYPGAVKMELQPESDGQAAIRPTQFIVHSIVGPWTARRTYEYWRDSTNLESHFGIGYAGDIAQYIGTETRADANAGANRRSDGTGAISVETASNSTATDPWTDEQVEELVKAGVWAHQHHGVPLRICRSHDDRGFGYHSMFRQWSTSGTACPGPARIRQFREVVFPAIVARATGKTTDTVQGDADMPDYINLGIARPQSLRPGKWESIEFTAEWADETGDHTTGGTVFARGPVRFTGSLSLTATGLPTGDVIQARMAEYAGEKHAHNHPVDEIVGTAGGTFKVVPLTKALGRGRTMRIFLLNQSSKPVTITSAVLTVLAWKG